MADCGPGGGTRCSTSAWASRSSRSTVSPVLRQGADDRSASMRGRAPSHGTPRSAVSGSSISSPSPLRPRSAARARGKAAWAPVPSPRGVRNICVKSPSAWGRSGVTPKICSPSRICSSLRSHRKLSSFSSFSPASSSAAIPQSAAIPARSAVIKISLNSASDRARSMPAASKYSSICDSISAITPWLSACVMGGVRWSRITAAVRRFACAPSPGSFTMNG